MQLLIISVEKLVRIPRAQVGPSWLVKEEGQVVDSIDVKKKYMLFLLQEDI